jgi:hypothetical protein
MLARIMFAERGQNEGVRFLTQIGEQNELLAKRLRSRKHSYITFTPSEAGDKNGILYHIGVGGDVKNGTWANPAQSGKVAVTVSDGGFAPHLFVGRESGSSGSGWCDDARDKYVEIDLKEGHAVRLTHYSLAYSGGGCCNGGTWSLFGRETAGSESEWVALCTDVHCAGFGDSEQKLFEVSDPPAVAMQCFKVVCTGRDSSTGCFCFHIGRLELYGDMLGSGSVGGPFELLPRR